MRYLLILSLVALALPAQSASIVYESRAAWELAVGGPVYTETFDSVTPQSIPSGSGTLTTPHFDIGVYGFQHGASITDHFRGDLHRQESPEGYNTIVSHEPVTAFAVDVLYIEFVTGIDLVINGQTFRHVPIAEEDGDGLYVTTFFGVVSDAPFSTVTIRGGGSAARFYELDDVSLAPVPEPHAWTLLALAALAVRALR